MAVKICKLKLKRAYLKGGEHCDRQEEYWRAGGSDQGDLCKLHSIGLIAVLLPYPLFIINDAVIVTIWKVYVVSEVVYAETVFIEVTLWKSFSNIGFC